MQTGNGWCCHACMMVRDSSQAHNCACPITCACDPDLGCLQGCIASNAAAYRNLPAGLPFPATLLPLPLPLPCAFPRHCTIKRCSGTATASAAAAPVPAPTPTAAAAAAAAAATQCLPSRIQPAETCCPCTGSSSLWVVALAAPTPCCCLSHSCSCIHSCTHSGFSTSFYSTSRGCVCSHSRPAGMPASGWLLFGKVHQAFRQSTMCEWVQSACPDAFAVALGQPASFAS